MMGIGYRFTTTYNEWLTRVAVLGGRLPEATPGAGASPGGTPAAELAGEDPGGSVPVSEGLDLAAPRGHLPGRGAAETSWPVESTRRVDDGGELGRGGAGAPQPRDRALDRPPQETRAPRGTTRSPSLGSPSTSHYTRRALVELVLGQGRRELQQEFLVQGLEVVERHALRICWTKYLNTTYFLPLPPLYPQIDLNQA
jgi:hypothetical protein